MTDTTAPERIWAWPEKGWYAAGASSEPTMAFDDEAEFVRADTVQALIAEAVEAQRERDVKIAASHRYQLLNEDDWSPLAQGYETAAREIAAALQGKGEQP